MDQTTGPNDDPSGECDERIIRGAEAIAEHIFGDRASRRKIYYLAECSKIPMYSLPPADGLQRVDQGSGIALDN
jgi:hypothetical protein